MSALRCFTRSGCLKVFSYSKIGLRNVLSSAYSCEDAWQRRLESPLLKDIKMKQYFIEVDKKFATKKLASGVDIDLFACCVKEESELEELEHLLYRFRRTKRSVEILDSTHHATVRALLKFKDYETLFRILDDRACYGVFPDLYCYNLMMDTFLEEKRYRDAAEIAVLMMLQEDFSNQICRILGLYSCHMFLKECTWESWDRYPKIEEKEDDDDEDVYIRVPFLKNPWFDDHFEIRNPQHLIGKTFYLIGREMNDTVGRTCQLIGLGLYEKWEKAAAFLEKISCSDQESLLLEDGVAKFKNCLLAIPDDEEKSREKWTEKFEPIFQSLKETKKIETTSLDSAMGKELQKIPKLEGADIKDLLQLFPEWEKMREDALNKQNKELDRETRIKIIEEKKEYLYWKEKLLFFFENEDDIMKELAVIEKIETEEKGKLSEEDTYQPPQVLKVPPTPPKFKIKNVVI